MAIKTHFLGSTRISGDDAKEAARKIKSARVKVAAKKSAQRGIKLAAAFAKAGSVRVTLPRRAASAK